MKFSVLALVVAVQGSVHASGNYPKIVSWERTNSASFVSEPNLLEGVDNFVPSVIHSVPGRREEHVYTDREIPGEKLSCINNPTSTEPRLKTMRRDLPGAFVCENKTLFVIPVIQVELHRFFNVSLDFLKLQNPDKIRLLRFQPLPEGISVELSPVGIVSVSGIFREGEGTLALRLSFYNAPGEKKPFYKIKVLFYIKTGEEKPNRQRIEVRMAHGQTAVRASDAPEQIRAIKCASEAVSLPPWSFCGVNSESEFAKELTLRASVEIPEGYCPTEPRKSEASCGPFIITEILFNSTKCDWSSRRSSEGSSQLDQRPGDGSDSVESQVNDAGYEMEVVLKNNEFVTGPPASVSTSTPAPTTLPPQDLGADPALVESEKPAGLDNDADLDSIASSTPGGRLLQNGVTDKIMEDPRLKTAMYGLLGLAGIVFTVIFLFLFSRLELCKKKTGYDPVFMTRLSDENAKIA